MNSLTWYIYLAEVFPNIVFSFVFAAIASVAYIAMWAACNEDKYFEEKKEQVAFWNKQKATFRQIIMCITIPCCILFAITHIFLPGKKTMYLMAASELGEEVVLSEEATEIKNLLKEYLKKSLKDE